MSKNNIKDAAYYSNFQVIILLLGNSSGFYLYYNGSVIEHPGANVIKLFFLFLEVPSLTFMSKARGYPSTPHIWYIVPTNIRNEYV